MEEKQDKELSRRDFIKAAGVTTATVVASSLISGGANAFAAALPTAAPRVIGANDRINIGIIGIGGMGGGHLHNLKNMEQEQNISIVAVCDVWHKRRMNAQATAQVHIGSVYGDYRRLLARKDIDAVLIATPDHWHGPIACAAMEAGKHVYVEKPMTHTFDEALKMLATAKSTKKIVQVGAQGCTDAKWHTAGDIVKAGKIGKIIWAQGSYCRNNPNGEWNYGIDPEMTEQTCDWKSWLGSAPKRPFSPERYFRWRKFWDYGNGIIGDLWPHRLYPLMVALDIEEFPSRVSCVGKNICDTDKGNGELRDVADATLLQVEFPSGAMIFLAGSTVNELGLEDVIRGQKANIYFGGGKVQIKPERPYTDEIEAEDVPIIGPGESHAEHEKNWLYAIRNNVQPNCGIERGIRGQAMVSMAEKSYRENKMVRFDPVKMKMIG